MVRVGTTTCGDCIGDFEVRIHSTFVGRHTANWTIFRRFVCTSFGPNEYEGS
jgi:hypothetical protein